MDYTTENKILFKNPNHFQYRRSKKTFTKKMKMKQKKSVFIGLVAVAVIIGGIVFASDHNDAPSVAKQTTDITDLYVFAGADTNNLVFVANTQGLLAPASTGAASFDPDILIQINIDNNGDHVEDLVIQAIYSNGKVNFYGPVAPSMTGLQSKLEGNIIGSVAVTPYGAQTPIISTTASGIQLFAGSRDDPFFFDLNQYHKILAGTATGFNNPGSDTFAGTNVMSVVVEVPKSLLNSTGNLNVWLTTKKKS
jgi:hypothetical protein